jgi:hypothetical protein
MDLDRIAAKLHEFVAAVRAVDRLSHGERYWEDGRWIAADDEMRRLLPAVRAIARKLDPAPSEALDALRADEGRPEYLAVANELIGLVEHMEELDEMLGPDGAVLSDAGFHPWVHNSSRALWDDGHRRAAIQAAALQVEVQLQGKLGRLDVSGAKLLGQTFTLDDPAPGRPRLRLPGIPAGSEQFRSAHEGAMHFGMGCFQAIRNLAAHHPDEPEEDEALEALAALSLLSRWIDVAELEHAPEDEVAPA